MVLISLMKPCTLIVGANEANHILCFPAVIAQDGLVHTCFFAFITASQLFTLLGSLKMIPPRQLCASAVGAGRRFDCASL